MPKNHRELPEVNAWHASTMRLTAFPVDPDSVDEASWWKNFVGTEPDTATRKKLERQYEGTYEGAGLQLAVNPLRVQWDRFPLIDPKDPPNGLPSLGTLPSVTTDFEAMMRTWLETSPPLNRLGFGAVLHQPVDGHESGYELLNEYLPFVQVDPEATDFIFNVNRRRASTSGVEGLEINRLMKWSLAKWHMGVLVGDRRAPPRQMTPASGFACRLELDINSMPELEGELPQDRIIPLWTELVDLANEIAAEGDKP